MATCKPFSFVLLTHEAVRRGLDQLDTYCDNAAPDSLDKLSEGFVTMTRALALHTRHENDALYPSLHEKRPGLAEPFIAEHAEEMDWMVKIDELLEAARTDDAVIVEAAKTMRAWTENYRKHMQGEEETLVPVLPQAFVYDESVEVIRQIMSLDLHEFEKYQLPWVVQRLDDTQREVYLAMLEACAPPESRDEILSHARAV